jgi:division protein CdvB (Snf7/Vps24/ESCRT-III family)
MAVKALDFKMEEAEISDMKEVADMFNMSVTDLVKNAVREYVTELKKAPFYRLTANVQEASAEESEEILDEIDKMSDDDLTIVSTKRFSV